MKNYNQEAISHQTHPPSAPLAPNSQLLPKLYFFTFCAFEFIYVLLLNFVLIMLKLYFFPLFTFCAFEFICTMYSWTLSWYSRKQLKLTQCSGHHIECDEHLSIYLLETESDSTKFVCHLALNSQLVLILWAFSTRLCIWIYIIFCVHAK